MVLHQQRSLASMSGRLRAISLHSMDEGQKLTLHGTYGGNET